MTGHTIVQPRGLGLPGLLINRQKRPGPHVAAGLAFDQYLESGSWVSTLLRKGGGHCQSGPVT